MIPNPHDGCGAGGYGAAMTRLARAVLPLAVPILLVGCGKGEERDTVIARAEHAATVPCALAGAALRPDCRLERLGTGAGAPSMLVLHHPDGGFRRLAVVGAVAGGGLGLAAADGAEPARVTVVDAATIEVAIGGDRYRLPATIIAGAPPAR